jgi:glycosyltransferase involved in cell wall biosynthesis
MRAYWTLVRVYWPRRHDYDILLCAYPGQFDVFYARPLSKLEGKPLVWDVFMSTWLIATERGLDHGNPAVVDILRRIERRGLQLPDLLIADTIQYAQWFERNQGVSAAGIRLVPTGADSDRFRPLAAPERTDGVFRVLYYGSFIPNHGVPTILAAAGLLHDDVTIQFEFVGEGPDLPAVRDDAQRLKLTNVTFTPWLDGDALTQHIAAADLCLGAFGTTPQSMMTVHNKVYECLAMARPVLTGDSPAVRDALAVDQEVFVCARANPAALADAIRALRSQSELLERVALAGHARFCSDYTIERLGQVYKEHLVAFTHSVAGNL